jgi:transcriptional regulator with XRE-family HTH domain
LKKLRLRLIAATSAPGAKTALAKEFKVSRSAVSQWLSGDTSPGAETALRLLAWVGDVERRKLKMAALHQQRRRKQTRSRQTSYESPKSSRKIL